MSSKFKVGDRVRDITDENNEEAIVIATQGATIKVEWTLDNGLLVNPNGNRFWPEDDFELVTPADSTNHQSRNRW